MVETEWTTISKTHQNSEILVFINLKTAWGMLLKYEN